MFDRPGGPKVLLSLFQIASGVGFEIGLIATQSVLADVIGAGVMVRDEDAGVVTELAADDLATGEGIDPTEAGAVR
jgi:hypothetical protein